MRRTGLTLLAPCLVLPLAAVAPGKETERPFEAKVRAHALAFRDELSSRIEALLRSGKLSVPQLFDTFYIPIPDTYPQKFHTQYDRIFDETLQRVLDGFLAREPRFVYVILADVNGYVPTHNTRFAAPLTGSRDYDLKHNQAKRLFNDRPGLAASRNQGDPLLQECLHEPEGTIYDLSVPVFVRGKHWGCLRIGFTQH